MDRPKQMSWVRMALPLMMLTAMLVIYFPLPATLMDFLLAANLTVSVVLLLATLFVKSTLELKVFPSLLLVTTLSRLSLNVATTRLILSRGAIDHEGAAGEIVKGFAEFVAGNSIVVGSIIFLILFVIQFVVITKGATRIGEVAARFALDSLPGQQMAIDADLNSGAIDWEEAKRQREALRQMADFQGAMDGASKYIRGDAVAGLLIVAINILGGLVQGMLAGMSLEQAAMTFTRLTIGDGLVSQLPALLISIAAGLLVTRGTAKSDLSEDTVSQLTSSPIVLFTAAGFLFLLPVANLPWVPLWTLGGCLVLVGYLVSQASKANEKTAEQNQAVKKLPSEPQIERFLETDQLELQVGMQLLSLCNSNAGGNMVAEIAALRREVAQEWGIVLPKVRIRDNLELAANRFRFLLNGNPVFEGVIEKDKKLFVFRRDEFPMREPRSGLIWAPYSIWSGEQQIYAPLAAQVLSPTQAVVQSLRWIVKEYGEQLLTRDGMNELVNEVGKAFPRLVQDTIPEVTTMGQLQRVCRQLLREGIALRPLHLILEALNDRTTREMEVPALAAAVREALREHTIQRLRTQGGQIACFGISDELTESLEEAISGGDERTSSGKFSANIRRNLRAAVEAGRKHLLGLNCEPVLLVSPEIFEVVKQTVSEVHPRVFVLGEHEVLNDSILNKVAEITPGDLSHLATSSSSAA